MSNASRHVVQSTSAHPDAEIIETCIAFAVAAGGIAAAFKVDPTGECDFASKRDTVYLRQEERLLAALVEMKPVTMDGLRAKAAIVEMVIDQRSEGQEQFFKSLAADVISMQRAQRERVSA